MRTQVIARRRDFTSLFSGFTKMRAISYVLSPDLLLEFLDEHGYATLEVVVGENLSDSYRKGLEQKGITVVRRLAELVEQGRLRVLVPKRSIHTKLYLLEAAGHIRVIQTSANLTDTAREASRQVNYAWYMDLPLGDPLLEHVTKDYQSHTELCSVFMEDLTKLFREQPEVSKEQLVEIWLRGGVVDDQLLETRRVFDEISSEIATLSGPAEETIVAVRLPENPAEKRHVERLLAPLEPIATQNQLHVNGSRFIR